MSSVFKILNKSPTRNRHLTLFLTELDKSEKKQLLNLFMYIKSMYTAMKTSHSTSSDLAHEGQAVTYR